MHRRDDGSFEREELPDDPIVVIGHGFDLPDENDPAIQAEAARLEAEITKDEESWARIYGLVSPAAVFVSQEQDDEEAA